MPSDDIDPTTTTLSGWLDRLAEAHGAPGGGAACGVLAAIAAALLGMVAGYTSHPDAQAAIPRLTRLRHDATAAAEEDGIRSARFGAALAAEDGPEREHRVRVETVAATDSSLAVGRVAGALVSEIESLRRVANPHVEADLLVAAGALRASLDGAIATIAADLEILRRHGDDALRPRIDGFSDALRQLIERRAVLERDEFGRPHGGT